MVEHLVQSKNAHIRIGRFAVPMLVAFGSRARANK